MKKTNSLKWKLFKYISSFVLILLTLLFIFQTLLLQPFYEKIKTNEIINVGEDIANNLGSENLDKYISSKTHGNEMCIVVVNENEGYSSSDSDGCQLTKLTTNEFLSYTQEAINNGGTYLVSNPLDTFEFKNSRVFKNVTSHKSLIYVKITRFNGYNYVIMVNTNISPLNATTKTIKYQLTYISIGVIFATLLLVYLLINRIVKPLEIINIEAKHLSEGKYKEIQDTKLKEFNELNSTLKEASVNIQKADKAKRDLIANVSHDLRTPLTLISGYGEMMIDLPNEKTDENIQIIVDEAKRMSNLINDLLDLSKLQENKLTLNKTIFSITKLINEQKLIYEQYSNNPAIILELNEEVFIEADKERITQVINNFVYNAINYSDSNIIIKQKIIEEKVRIEIKDFGVGIAEKDLPFIWDRYFKINETHIRSNEGSGIGLAIAKEILEMHNFVYGAYSKLNEGSTFYFEAEIKKLL